MAREMKRRDFVRSSAAAVAGLSLLGAPAPAASRLSPNDRIRLAIIGLRGRGAELMRSFHALADPNVEVAALCDVDEPILLQRAAEYEKLWEKKPLTFNDTRQVLEQKTIDAVVLATPNHWHALGTVWACQAGKDVYVEKPGSHNIFEGRKVVEAARKYNRIVEHGTQNRSSPNIVEAIQKLKEGVIGRVYLARGIAYKTRGPLGRLEPVAVPAGLNWDAWQGPAPDQPYARLRHRGWHLLWDYGNGDIGNQGVHELDIMRWALDLDTHPTKIAAMGGHYIYQDDQQAPHVHAAMFEYQGRDLLLTFETRSGFTNDEAGMGTTYPFLDKRNVVGVIFIGTEGYMILPDYTSYYTFLGRERTPGPRSVGAGDIANLPHLANFLQAVRSRKPADLAADARQLHLSSALPHLANIAYRTGRMLRFDPQTERFVRDEEANRLLTRQYRKPYVVPEKV